MAAIVWRDVEAIASELAGDAVDERAKSYILAYVNGHLAVREFGGEDSPATRLARIYLAAHFGSLASSASSGGATVVSESAGDLSRTYDASTSAAATGEGVGTTVYGKAYQALIRGIGARAVVIL